MTGKPSPATIFPISKYRLKKEDLFVSKFPKSGQPTTHWKFFCLFKNFNLEWKFGWNIKIMHLLMNFSHAKFRFWNRKNVPKGLNSRAQIYIHHPYLDIKIIKKMSESVLPRLGLLWAWHYGKIFLKKFGRQTHMISV